MQHFLKSNAIAASPTGRKAFFSRWSLSTLFDLLEGKIFAISSEAILVLSKFMHSSAESNSVDWIAEVLQVGLEESISCSCYYISVDSFLLCFAKIVLKFFFASYAFLLFLILTEFWLILFLILLIKIAKIYKTHGQLKLLIIQYLWRISELDDAIHLYSLQS